MLADLFFDVVLSGLLKIIASAWRGLAEGVKAVHHVADVGRRGQERNTPPSSTSMHFSSQQTMVT